MKLSKCAGWDGSDATSQPIERDYQDEDVEGISSD